MSKPWSRDLNPGCLTLSLCIMLPGGVRGLGPHVSRVGRMRSSLGRGFLDRASERNAEQNVRKNDKINSRSQEAAPFTKGL